MSKYLTALLLALATVSGFSHAAPVEQPGDGDKALFISNVTTAPTYNLGMFLNDKTMAYGTLRIISSDGDSAFGIGGGVRMYQERKSPLRTFFDANLMISSVDGVEDSFGIGGYFGAEYLAAKNVSIGAKVGATFSNVSPDAPGPAGDSYTVLDIGVAEVMLNFYF